MNDEQMRLVADNRLLALKLASVMWEKNKATLDRDEAISNAYLGLISAARNWDPSREEINPEDLENGKAFSGYARHRILGAIRDWMRKEDYVSRNQRKVYKDLRAAGLDDGLSLGDLSEKIGEPLDKVKSALQAVSSSPVSIEDHDEESAGLALTTPAELDTESSVLVGWVSAKVVDKMQALDPRYQVILALRYYEGLPMYEIASRLNSNTARIGNLHNIAILELLHTMKEATNG